MENGGLVTNNSGGMILGVTGVYVGQAGVSVEASSVVNTGKIVGTGNAIQLGEIGTSVQSGSVTNITGGSIVAEITGIGIFNIGPSYVVNQTGAAISDTIAVAGDAIYMLNPGTVTNQGTIQAAAGRLKKSGVWLANGGSVTNSAGATIQGNRGVYVGSGGTLTVLSTVANYGTIIAAAGDDAVYFGAGAPNSRLIVGPSAAFTGSIAGGAGVLELASAGSAATLGGFGVTISNVGALQFDSVNWTVKGIDASFDNMTAIVGFLPGDQIEVSDFKAVSYVFASNVLTLYSFGNAATIAMPIHASPGQGFNLGVYGANGTDITECFAAGTRIATPDGETAVEDLASGDRVLAHFTGVTPIQWVGHRHVDCTRHPNPETVWPVRVRAGAFGASLPCRDLLLSPNHAVFVDGELIPVRLLNNGLSIAQTPVDAVTYYHIELAAHDLLLAEGQPAESYLDVGDRENFANGDGVIRLYPDFGTRPCDSAAKWEMLGCAPLLSHGPDLPPSRSGERAGRCRPRRAGRVAVTPSPAG